VKDKQNIEELFQKTFEGFEADVNPQLWQGIQQQLPSGQAATGAEGAGSGSASSSAGSFGAITSAAVVKVAAVVGVATALVAGGYWLSTNEADQQAVNPVEEKIEEVATAPANDFVAEEEIAQQESNTQITTEKVVEEAVQTVKVEAPRESVAIADNKSKAANTTGSSNANRTAENSNAAGDNKVVASTSEQAVAKQPAKKTEAAAPKLDDQKTDDSPRAKASIHASVKRGALPLVVHFSNNDPLASSVHWDFGDGNTSESLSPRHTFNEPGSYEVILAVDNEEVVSRDTVLIVVHRSLTMMIPNMFTPNGDGINDAFRVEVENVAQFHCTIMDRSGKTVYEMNNIHSHWDGRDRFGNTMNEGNYFYVIKATTADGQTDIRKGVLMLKR
jgi:gliding motility-associated-like protein